MTAKGILLTAVLFVVGVTGMSLVFPQAPERQRSAEEIEWISTCGLISDRQVAYCKQDAEELFNLGYFSGNVQVEEN